MARTRQLSDLRDDAYKRADEENNTTRFPNAEVDRYINEGGAEMWGLIIEAAPKAWGENLTPQSITTLANTSSYNLANTTLRVLSVRLIDGSNSYTLEPFNEGQEAFLEDSGSLSSTIRPGYYQVRRQTLYVAPPPPANLTLRVRFVPHWTELANNSDTWSCELPGTDTYMPVYAAKRMQEKNERWDAVAAMNQELQRLEDKIRRGAARGRDATFPPRITDTRRLRYHRLFTRYR